MDINRYNKKYRQFFRFCIVGLACTSLDAIIYYSFLIFASYLVALVSGYILSLIANYFLTIYWTFSAKPSLLNAIGIVAAHLFNLFVVRMGLMCLFVEKLSINESIAYLPMLVISVFTNFYIIKFIVNRIK